MNYYNEINEDAAGWLRELIALGALPDGDVDTRSIEDVLPHELIGYTQHHFFAGIGGWPLALQLAGWPADRPVVTGSCPCQPFSKAGKGAGFDDKRHLWPHFHWLISQLRPGVVLGEQTSSPDGRDWMQLVLADLEGLGYAGAAVDLCAAGVGAPHIRQRLYWLAYADGARPQGYGHGGGARPGREGATAQRGGPDGGLAHAHGDGLEPGRDGPPAARHGQAADPDRGAGGLADAAGTGRGASGRRGQPGERQPGPHPDHDHQGPGPGATHGFWADPDWLWCRDGKWRPAQCGTFPLAPRLPRGLVPGGDLGIEIDPRQTSEARSTRLKGFGNAIVPDLAAQFIRAFVEITG